MEIVRAGGAGAYVEDVDLASLSSEPMIKQLRQALGEYGVLFFRNQALEPADHIAFARKFGEININRFFTALADHPSIAEVRKEPEQQQNIGSVWHTDHSYDLEPAMGSILVARETPSIGGDTIFTNMFAAYEALSDGLKQTLLGLNAVHSSRHVFGAEAYKDNDRQDLAGRIGNTAAATQDAIHPVVVAHPISGKSTLFVNPQFTVRFKGWTSEESQPLLSFLYQHGVRPEFTHRFQWKKGSVAFWDNRATWHLALNDYQGERRIMHRITVAGEALTR